MTRFGLILGSATLVACSDKPSLVPIQDGSYAMLKDVSDDCGSRLVHQPEHCIWESRYDLRLERNVQVRVELGEDGTPLRAEDVGEGTHDGAACAMALRYDGPAPAGGCIVKLHLVRYVSDVASAGRGDPNIDCTGYAGPGALCYSSTGASPVR